jgi:hypothetical protein
MQRYIRVSLSLLLLIGLRAAPAQVVGQKVGPQFPYLTSSARLLAIADAGDPLLDTFSGFGSNPAVLGLMKTSIADYTFLRVQKGVTFEHLGIAYKATRSDGIAFAVDILHFGGTDFYTNSNVRDLGFELRTGLAYGREIAEALSMGINLQAITSTTGPQSVWAFGGDFGLAYAPSRYIRYGLTVKGISSDYKVVAPILRTDVFTPRISRVLALSIAIDYPLADQTQKIVLAFQNEKIIGERRVIYRFGSEYYPFWSVDGFRATVRGGFIIRGSDVEPRFGLGVSFAQFAFDYGYRYTRRYFQPSQMFTLTVRW